MLPAYQVLRKEPLSVEQLFPSRRQTAIVKRCGISGRGNETNKAFNQCDFAIAARGMAPKAYSRILTTLPERLDIRH
jgi:hypothetical protein